MSRTKTIKLAICQNPDCGLEFNVGPGCRGRYCSRNCMSRGYRVNIRPNSLKISYYQNPKLCLFCEEPLCYEQHKVKQYCNSSCSAKRNNVSRVLSIYKMKKARIAKPCWKNSVVGSYTKIIKNVCMHCNLTAFSYKRKKYCVSCDHLYSDGARHIYSFKFNIFEYSDIFDLDLLSSRGFYNNKPGKENLHGLVRDHKLSINDAIKNNYNSYYISHPLNCELMSQSDNAKKRSRSSITFEELKKLVDSWDSELRRQCSTS